MANSPTHKLRGELIAHHDIFSRIQLESSDALFARSQVIPLGDTVLNHPRNLSSGVFVVERYIYGDDVMPDKIGEYLHYSPAISIKLGTVASKGFKVALSYADFSVPTASLAPDTYVPGESELLVPESYETSEGYGMWPDLGVDEYGQAGLFNDDPGRYHAHVTRAAALVGAAALAIRKHGIQTVLDGMYDVYAARS